MILAILNTGSFDFVVLGTDQQHAERIVARAWNKHRRQTGASLTAAEAIEDTNFVPINPGEAVRDYSTIVKGVK